MSVTLTEKAAKEVQRVMSEQKMPEATILRVGVVGGGCSGFQYSLGFKRGTLKTVNDSKSLPEVLNLREAFWMFFFVVEAPIAFWFFSPLNCFDDAVTDTL